MTMPFQPPPGLRNPHIQSILSSTGPRRIIAPWRARELNRDAREVLLDCGDGVRLQGKYTAHPDNSRGLAILIHGWEGCSESMYILSTAVYLFNHGFSIFRLNMRDHGSSHHLNPELFHSMRLDEVVAAVKSASEQFPHEQVFLGGFSLGGNFSLRIAVAAPEVGLKLDKVVAVCPVVDPNSTMKRLNEGLFIYHDYFVRKWKRSLQRKLHFFPELGYGDDLLQQKTLDDMNRFFVPKHTGYETAYEYLDAYAIHDQRLADLSIPSHVITSRDDPVIPVEDFQRVARPDTLQLEIVDHGGHCAFLDSYRMTSWVEKRMEQLFRPQ